MSEILHHYNTREDIVDTFKNLMSISEILMYCKCAQNVLFV